MLLLEQLGERIVPALFNWTGDGGDQLWSNPENWSSNGQPGVPGAGDTAQFQSAAPSIVDENFGGMIANLYMPDPGGVQRFLDVSHPLQVTNIIEVANTAIAIGPASQLTGREVTASGVSVNGGGTFFVLGTQALPGQMVLSDSSFLGGTTLHIDTYASLGSTQYNAFTGGRLVNRGTTELTLENDFMDAEVENRGTLVVAGAGSFTDTAINNLSGSFKFQVSNFLDEVAIDNRAQFELNATVSLEDISLTNSGHFKYNAIQTYDGGSIENSGTIEQLAELTYKNTAITSEGTYEWDAGELELENGTVFDNRGTVDTTCNEVLDTGGPVLGRFDNHGLFKKSAGTGSTLVTVAFNSEPLLGVPTVEVATGKLLLNSGGNVEGYFVAHSYVHPQDGLSPAILAFNDGIWNLTGDTTFQGVGIVRIFRSTLDGGVPKPTLNNTGTLEVWDDPFARGKLFNVELASSGRLRLSGGHLKNVVGSIDSLTIDGASEQFIDQSDLTLNGDTIWEGANDIKLRQSTIQNRGTFDIQNERKLIEGDMVVLSKFVNEAGVVKKTNGAPGGQTEIDVFFEQAGGDLDLNGFKMAFDGGIEQTDANSDTILDNGTLVAAGTFLVKAGRLRGFGKVEGDLKIDGATVDLTEPTGFGALEVTGKYEQTTASTLKVKVGNNNERDRVTAGGKVTLAGALQVTKKPGTTINPGNTYTIIESATERVGTFGSITGDGTWMQVTTNKKLTLEAQ